MEVGMEFDGFKSVVEMLSCADEDLRKKILKGIEDKDPELAIRITQELTVRGEKADVLILKDQNKAQQSQNIRNYSKNKV